MLALWRRPTPISKPNCNGQGIVVLGSVTTAGLYTIGAQRLLAAPPNQPRSAAQLGGAPFSLGRQAA